MKPPTLKILTWNLSYAYGLGSEGISQWGHRYVQKGRDHFEFSLNAMGDLIRRLGVDIVLLQEVDFNSARSHHLNQMEWLSRRSGLLYRDKIVSWDHPYVPYPGLHPKNHFRSVRSGGAILSRFPIEPLQHDLLTKPRENSRIYNSFYLNRYLQIVRVLLPSIPPHHQPRTLHLLNCHLEAFSEDNRALHWLRLSERLVDFDIDLAGGDFNGQPDLHPLATSGWSGHAAPDPTFPAHRPELFLDGFVLRRQTQSQIKVITLKKLEVLDTGDLSDHRPVYFELDLEFTGM
jgi:endonuclease/exonuclease/phosphatase family metal-dependent hydrolase